MKPVILYVGRRRLTIPTDIAICDAAVSYMKSKNYPYEEIEVDNVVDMSPDGFVPVAIVNGRLITGLSSLILNMKSLASPKSPVEDLDLLSKKTYRQTIFSWLADNLRVVTLYFVWHPRSDNHDLLCQLYSKRFPFPLDVWMRRRHRSQYLSYLKAASWYDKDPNSLVTLFKGVCVALSEAYQNGPYFFARQKPGKLDALVSGYWRGFKENPQFFPSFVEISLECDSELFGQY